MILRTTAVTGLALLGAGDPLTGAGFAGAGILGLVLTWLLFKHLPEQNARLDQLVKDFIDRMDRDRADYLSREAQRDATFAAALKAVLDGRRE